MDIFWVLVLQEPNKKHIVTLILGIAEMLRKEPAENRLLYLRIFTSMQDAIGHIFFCRDFPLQVWLPRFAPLTHSSGTFVLLLNSFMMKTT